ncbi:saccharopine dehydrogenase [Mycobacterium sp. CBMA293]|uniref:saccharopine dehydrogenase family protein n=1 Tax=unclassified Mycolicibacterium TaxID=2636767 RepID=UPI0012DC62CE|nr:MULTISPECIES: saccharopine dehydrogenase NADP-binding domain-containing protein [unclassified Mycolicibacterium]MUL47452.1 saccharopine dehydrogenase [Mycolicibacterium sp. CBMA 360]MUL94806.1 saccharopine dehydrogenase [Mycolicibacterium sp. CBMA 230]MUL59438.1 saccharopine dehydrogenase [Mycolicibacterium sp. CBMA 335]MUL71163.1 saccharopine dehydrogenase [Mycolicibacterium sp. CBMA 311]MUM03647.1 saccharopine dehydrogenase [Mycolicibacterium sp. CBMA 213]
MRILALGGPGAMGAVAVRLAAQMPGVDEIVVADRDRVAAERLCRQLADAPVPVSAAQVDVTDVAALRALLEPADLVVNTVGPYYRFGLPVLRAAIAAGTHYIDICDDWEPTVQMLDLDENARAAGVCAVIGMGASPGVSNLLAATAAAELDSVRDAYTAWPVDGGERDGGDVLLGPDGRPSAAAVHWMLQSSGKICTVHAGELTFQRPLRPIELSLPHGRRGVAYSIGHPEPITLQRTLGLTGDAVNLMVIRPQTLAYLDVLRRDIDRRRLTHEAAAMQFAKPNMVRYLRSLPHYRRSKGPGTLPPFFAAVSGTRCGRDSMVLAHLDLPGLEGFFGDMARATGIPLALGISQIIDGTAQRPGVHPPDAVIDCQRFFKELDRHLDRSADRPLVVVEREERA